MIPLLQIRSNNNDATTHVRATASYPACDGTQAMAASQLGYTLAPPFATPRVFIAHIAAL